MRTGLLLFSILAILTAAPALAQNGAITGVVVDAETGETIIGANVVLEGTAVGAATDLDGRYAIEAVAPGTYAVVFSFVGFTSRTVRGVVVESGKATRLDVDLAPEALGLGELVVEAEAARDAEAALLRARRKAAAVSDAVSAEAIGRAGSASAADAMRRVTGASVVGGRYVYVRGLGDRYLSTQLNGATLPSADPDRNAVPLDLFPAALLDNIVTTKTFTPDRPGSFTGGAVDIGTKAFPERFTFAFSSSAGYDSRTTGRGGFLTYGTGGTDWLGFDDGTRALPAAWQQPGTASPNHVQARRDAAQAQELDRLSRAFNPEMTPRAATAPVETSYGLSVGDQVTVFGRPLGFLGSFSYDRAFSSYTGGTAATYLLTGRVDEVDELNVQQRLADARSTADVLWGGLGTVAFKPHPHHSVGATVLYNRSATSEARYLVGEVPRNFAPERRLESRVLAFTERAIASYQLRGEHAFPTAAGLRVDWNAARVVTRQEEPDVRFFASDFTVFERDGRIDTAYAVAISNYTAPTRYFRDLVEDGWDGGLDATLPFAAGGAAGSVKAGAAANLRHRAFGERRFEYVLRTPYDGDPAAFFAQVGVLGSAAGANGTTYTIGNYVVDASSPRNSYEGDQAVYAGYGMVELRLFGRLRVVTGARYEHTRLDVASRDTTVAAAHLRGGDWLPSLNVVYELGDANVRAAYGKTLARPTFRELAPFTSFAYINAPTLSGNPALRRTLVHNVDLRWEWFVRPGEIVAASGFYKRFVDPIERTILNNNFETRFENVDRADVYGVELEARKRLDDVWRPLAGLEVGGNLTLAHSRVDIPAEELAQLRAFDPDAAATRPLQGQSPYVVNADLTYHAPAASVSLLYNVFGRRLSDVSLGGTPDLYELPFHSLDVVAARQVLRWLRVRATVRNVLDAEARHAYPFKGTDYFAAIHTRGRSFSLGLTMAY